MSVTPLLFMQAGVLGKTTKLTHTHTHTLYYHVLMEKTINTCGIGKVRNDYQVKEMHTRGTNMKYICEVQLNWSLMKISFPV